MHTSHTSHNNCNLLVLVCQAMMHQTFPSSKNRVLSRAGAQSNLTTFQHLVVSHSSTHPFLFYRQVPPPEYKDISSLSFVWWGFLFSIWRSPTSSFKQAAQVHGASITLKEKCTFLAAIVIWLLVFVWLFLTCKQKAHFHWEMFYFWTKHYRCCHLIYDWNLWAVHIESCLEDLFF